MSCLFSNPANSLNSGVDGSPFRYSISPNHPSIHPSIHPFNPFLQSIYQHPKSKSSYTRYVNFVIFYMGGMTQARLSKPHSALGSSITLYRTSSIVTTLFLIVLFVEAHFCMATFHPLAWIVC
jgi:hypothetical protein